MPISGFTTDYTNRTVDINILQVNSYTNGQLQKDAISFGNPSQYVTGIQKLVQKYVILFLTNLGSQVNSPDFGTNFLPSIQQNSNLLSGVTLNHTFNFSNLIVSNELNTYQKTLAQGAVPSDELFKTASLQSYSASGGNISLSILITSQAGTNVTFVLPVPLNN